jgi:fibronectin-binding autotransporter adhesin
MVRLRGCVLAAAVFAISLCGSAFAQTTINWTGDGGSDNTGWGYIQEVMCSPNITNWDRDIEASPIVSTDVVGFNQTTAMTSMVDGDYTIQGLVVAPGSGTLDLTSCEGSLTITSSLTDSSSNYANISVPISGCANVVSNGGGNIILSGDNSYNGGTSITNAGTLTVGSDTALGTGNLMLSAGTNLTTTECGPVTLCNDIVTCGTGSVYIFDGTGMTGGADLTLNGMISGPSRLAEIASFNDSDNTLTLTNGGSTFSGGVSVEGGNAILVVGASSTGCEGSVSQGPLGTGTLMLSSGNVFTTTGDDSYTINNDISLCNGGTITLLDENMGKALTLGGNITGVGALEVAAATCGDPNTLTFTSGASTFGGGLTVDSGNTTLVIGASSTGPSGVPTSGPLGTNTVTLGNGTDFTTTGGTCFTISNNIVLSGCGTVYLLGEGCNNMLTLIGAITGSSGLDVGQSGGTSSLTLSGTSTTFSGGLTVEPGSNTLVVGVSGVGVPGAIDFGPLGTGSVTLGDGATLTTPPDTGVQVLNDIQLGTGSCNSTVTVGGSGSGVLTLLGTISDYGSPAMLKITGPTTLAGSNTYSGGTTVCNTSVTVENNSGLGSGPLTANSSTVSFDSPGDSPALNYATLNNSTLNFNGTGPVILNNLTMMCGSIVDFAPGTTATLENPVSDAPGSDNTIETGTGTSLIFLLGEDPTYNGEITGGGSVSVTSAGGNALLDLAGTNTYSGGTTVNSGALLVADSNGALGSGPVVLHAGSGLGIGLGTGSPVTITNTITANDGVAIGGYGTIAGTITAPQNIVIQNGSGVTGGRGSIGSGDFPTTPVVGSLAFGAYSTVTFGGDGIMQFSIMNPTGTAGTDYSAISVAGTLDVTATPGSPFTIYVIGVDSSGLVTGTANSTFNTGSAYSWTLVSAGTLSISGGFNAADFQINTTSFSNSTASHFYVTQSGNDLVLNFTPVPEPSTWILMAGGLCMVAGAAVRRRRRA